MYNVDSANDIPEISIIIPVRINSLNDNSLIRLKRLLQIIPSNFEIIVVDDGSLGKISKIIRQIVATRSYGSSVYHYLPTFWKIFSLARARNAGLYLASHQIIILHDVDFIGTDQIYLNIAQQVKNFDLINQKYKFFCVPIAFLTKIGTENYIKNFESNKNDNYWLFEEDLYGDDNLKFIVEGSSCIVANKNHLLEIGGHDNDYIGHGAEDFELLHRLSQYFPIGVKPEQYSKNTGSGFIKEYVGFRAYFALYGKEVRKNGCMLVHLFHKKRKSFFYYRHKINFAKLNKLMS